VLLATTFAARTEGKPPGIAPPAMAPVAVPPGVPITVQAGQTVLRAE
jgi:hypothetical protein